MSEEMRMILDSKNTLTIANQAVTKVRQHVRSRIRVRIRTRARCSLARSALRSDSQVSRAA